MRCQRVLLLGRAKRLEDVVDHFVHRVAREAESQMRELLEHAAVRPHVYGAKCIFTQKRLGAG